MRQRAQRAHGGARGQRQHEPRGPQRVAAEQREEPRRAGRKEFVVRQGGNRHAKTVKIAQRGVHPVGHAIIGGRHAHVGPRAVGMRRRDCVARRADRDVHAGVGGSAGWHAQAPDHADLQPVHADRRRFITLRAIGLSRGDGHNQIAVRGPGHAPALLQRHRHLAVAGRGGRRTALDLLHRGHVEAQPYGEFDLTVDVEVAAQHEPFRQRVAGQFTALVDADLRVDGRAVDIAGDHRGHAAARARRMPGKRGRRLAVHGRHDARDQARVAHVESRDAGRSGVRFTGVDRAVGIAPQLGRGHDKRLHVVHPRLSYLLSGVGHKCLQ